MPKPMAWTVFAEEFVIALTALGPIAQIGATLMIDWRTNGASFFEDGSIAV